MPGLLEGKLGLIANMSERHGYPAGIAQACLREGARLAFGYQERFASHVQDLTGGIEGAIRVPLDLGREDTDEQIARAFE